jgi:hypothetical protein
MNELHLSTREQIMFDTFKKHGETSVEDLQAALKKAGEKPRGGTRSLTVSVRYLAYKIAPRGFSIQRVSALGRGNKARYRLNKPRRSR